MCFMAGQCGPLEGFLSFIPFQDQHQNSFDKCNSNGSLTSRVLNVAITRTLLDHTGLMLQYSYRHLAIKNDKTASVFI